MHCIAESIQVMRGYDAAILALRPKQFQSANIYQRNETQQARQGITSHTVYPN